MKGNRELDELLISYILNELNAEEQAYVEDHINSDEKSRLYFEEFQKTWRLLAVKQEVDRIDVNEEWKNFDQKNIREKQQLISIKKEEITGIPEDGEEDQADKKFIGRKFLASIVIAASLLSLIVLLRDYSTERQQNQKQVLKVRTPQPAVFPVFIKHEFNYSGRSKKLLLSDGSLVVLSNNSEISYEQPFAGNRRDVTLKGKADFQVAKDKSKPFTVYSLALATTALGTRFTVSAFENAEEIIVKLYEGKILVKSAASEVTDLKNGYHLLPGQQLVYSNKKYTAKLSSFIKKNPDLLVNDKSENFTDSIELPENRKGSWNMFNNQSLGQVLDDLEVLYNTVIVYSKKDVQKMYFIGRFDKADSLVNILDQIASLNNLKVTKKDNKFIITKSIKSKKAGSPG